MKTHAAPRSIFGWMLVSITLCSGLTAAAQTPLFKAAGPTAGPPLAPGSAEVLRARREGRMPASRVMPVDTASFAAITAVRRGDRVTLPLMAGESAAGTVNLSLIEGDGTVRVAGVLTGATTGSFFLGRRDGAVSGVILLPAAGLACRIEQDAAGAALLREVLISEVLCWPLPRMQGEPPRAEAAGPLAAPPILNSRPAAVAQLYLDFDGEVVTDPSWNGGRTITAAAYNLTTAETTEIFDRVKEDFLPFNINVTTDVARYNNAPVGSRMRCIITPTDEWYGNVGGVAYLNSFDRAGGSFSSTVPCWVFNSSVNSIAEAVSHELGHTMGLHHDGCTSPADEYFWGHGSGATSWAPIMGAGYSRTVVQWSKGEYQNASQTENDVAIISNATNGFGYAADEAGETIATAVALGVSGASVSQAGAITQAGDTDFFRFGTTGGNVTIAAAVATRSPNLDVELQIHDSSGAVVAFANPADALAATINTVLTAGTYYLRIKGSGAHDPLTNGYSTYGSIGAYLLKGKIPPPQPGTLQFSSAAYNVREDGGSATITVTRTGGSDGAVGVSYLTNNGTATAGIDYTTASGTLNWAAAESGSKSFAVPITNSTSVEPAETVLLGLGIPTGGATLGSPTLAVLTIADIDTFSLAYAAGPNGSLTGATSQNVPYGANGTAVTAVAATGCHFVTWSDGSTVNPRTDTNVTASLSVTASFEINTYTLTYAAGPHGSIQGASPQTVAYGGSGTAVTAMSDSGYVFRNWSDGSKANPRTDTNVTAPVNVTANFGLSRHTLTLIVDPAGRGTVAASPPPDGDGQYARGTAITLTPRGSNYFEFDQWSGDATGTDDPLEIMLDTDMTVAAHFLPPPDAEPGKYYGLIQNDPPTHPGTGTVSLKLMPTGSFTASIALGGVRKAMRGTFDGAGKAGPISVNHRGGASFDVSLQMSRADGELSGTVNSIGAGPSRLLAKLSNFDRRRNPAPLAGRYTLMIAPGTRAVGNPALPQGTGVGDLEIKPNGIGTLRATMADGAAFTGSAGVSADGSWPLYGLLYRRGGFAAGWMSFAPVAGAAGAGTLDWVKTPALREKFFAKPFSMECEAALSAYSYQKGVMLLPFAPQANNARLILSDGDLAAIPAPRLLTLGAGNKVQNPAGDRFRMTLTTRTGRFSGAFPDPQTGKPRKFNGVIFQAQDIGVGWFEGNARTGGVRLEAAP